MLGLFLVFVKPIFLEVWGGRHVPPRPPPGSAPGEDGSEKSTLFTLVVMIKIWTSPYNY